MERANLSVRKMRVSESGPDLCLRNLSPPNASPWCGSCRSRPGHRDFVEMLSALSAAGAEYLVVGAHALAAHGVPRATGDLDDFASPDLVFQIGLPPARIDLLTTISGLTFEDAWPRRVTVANSPNLGNR